MHTEKDSSPATAPSGIWGFALALYQQRNIAEQCLHLQDDYHIKVNLLLWCYWLEARARALNASHLELAEQRIDPFDQSYVQPLRQLRRQLKAQYPNRDTPMETLRQALKQAELCAEQQELIWLETLAQDWPKSIIASGSNCQLYLSHMQVPPALIETTRACFQQALASLATKAIY